MKRSRKKIIIFISTPFVFFGAFLLYLFCDGFYDKKFRTVEDKIVSSEQIDLTGLREVKASGGSNVTFGDIQRNLKHVKGKIIIVDGMQYFHGYINGIPTTLLGYHVTKPAFRHLARRFFVTGTLEQRPDLVKSGEEESKKYGFGYKNIRIGSRSVPSVENINEFINFYENVPENAWLHFHCHHGKGRTSMMLVMLDIMKNAPKVALKDIVKRQHVLGSSDLFDTEKWLYGTYTTEQLENRKKFIEQFYDFIVQRKAGGIQQWGVWKAAQKNETAQ